MMCSVGVNNVNLTEALLAHGRISAAWRVVMIVGCVETSCLISHASS